MSDPQSAETVFATFLAQRTNDDPSEFEALLARHPRLADELRELHADFVQLESVLNQARPRDRGTVARVLVGGLEQAPAEHASAPEVGDAWLARIRDSFESERRFAYQGSIGRGGMGAVIRVWDRRLHRSLAMKFARPAQAQRLDIAKPRLPDAVRVARFIAEAQITGQLDHPGVPPVHELGNDRDGQPYFTMRLVRGEEFTRVIEGVRSGAARWSMSKALDVLLRVCETIAFAHSRGVVHRDLKPSNVMVGEFGEVYVVDWGLARVLSDNAVHEAGAVTSVRSQTPELEGESPFVSRDGDVLGSPAYMSPEQARGEIPQVGPRSDVYAIGALLYHLLAGHAPHHEGVRRLSNDELIERVGRVRVTPLEQVAPRSSPELLAIVERAMAFDPEERYANVTALAEDLRAFRDRRVVAAYESGAWAEARKWVARNRLAAAALGGVFATLAVALVWTTAADRETRAASSRADQMGTEILRDRNVLLGAKALTELENRAALLWPATPERIESYTRWLADFRSIVDGIASDGESGTFAREGLRELTQRLELERAAERDTQTNVADPFSIWREQRFNDLAVYVERIEQFCDERFGLAGGAMHPQLGWGIERRLNAARTLRERSIDTPELAAAWERAAEAIRRSPHYGGLDLKPQLGLVPLRADPRSGFWEFMHVESGEAPSIDGDGRYVVSEATGIVLVLVPGGTFWMGAQRDSPELPNYHAEATVDEQPVRHLRISPFFLSKYELTQAQWLRAFSTNPSDNAVRYSVRATPIDGRHPVENIDIAEAHEVALRLGLEVPSEARWEYACRAGTDTPWSTGADRDCLVGSANLADRSAFDVGMTWPHVRDWPEFRDDYWLHAPVGSFAPNRWGFHDMHGNVFEFCADLYVDGGYAAMDELDPLLPRASRDPAVMRGGSYFNNAFVARSSHRLDVIAGQRGFTSGLRPARSIEP